MRAEGVDLVRLEAVEEVPADAGEVSRAARAASSSRAGVGEQGVVAAAVVLAALALDQALAVEPVDEPGDPAAAEQQPVGELAHPQLAVRASPRYMSTS